MNERDVVPTNLGAVPLGMTFFQAIEAMIGARKYQINPRHETGRLTLCETAREIWRIAETLPQPERAQLQLLAGAAFDFGKRMDRRLKQLQGVPLRG